MIKHPSIPVVSLGPDIPAAARHWRNTPEIRFWCRQFSLLSNEDHSKWLNKIAHDPTIKMFSIDVEGRHVGVCGLTSIDRVNQRAEFSMYIAHREQKKGYGGKALTLLLMHGFKDQNLNRIWGESFDGNPAQKLFRRLGLVYEGTQRQAYFRDGKFIDSQLWAITRDIFNELYSDRLSHSDECIGGSGKPVRVSSNADGFTGNPKDLHINLGPAFGSVAVRADPWVPQNSLGFLLDETSYPLGFRSGDGGTGNP